MPSDLHEKLDWFFENFDLAKAAKGEFEPSHGMSEDYDNACEEIETILGELSAFKREMSANLGHGAKSSWKYINTKEDSKDKYLIELPVSVPVPEEFQVKGKRGKGNNQVNKYRCPEVESLVQGLERAIDIKNEGKALGMKLVFAKFDDMRDTWKATAMATAMLGELLIRYQPSLFHCTNQSYSQMLLVLWLHLLVSLAFVGQLLWNAHRIKSLESGSYRVDTLALMSLTTEARLYRMT